MISCKNLPLLPFEALKSSAVIFNYLLDCGMDGLDTLSNMYSMGRHNVGFAGEGQRLLTGPFGGEHGCDAVCRLMLGSCSHATIHHFIV